MYHAQLFNARLRHSVLYTPNDFIDVAHWIHWWLKELPSRLAALFAEKLASQVRALQIFRGLPPPNG
jgi:hypothetical protein